MPPPVRRLLPVSLLILLTVAFSIAAAEKGRQELIGEVLGQPVSRDAIRTGEDVRLADELGRLFLVPVLAEFRKEHEQEVTPTASEIDFATAYFDEQHRERIRDEAPKLREQLRKVQQQLAEPGLTDKRRDELKTEEVVLQTQLKPPGRTFAVFVLKNWKFQRFLYDNFGGGRLLWQQAGTEAFDAMHQWLLAQEKAGKFKVTDPALRAEMLKYWTTQERSPFLVTDQEQIRRQFLEPRWVQARPGE